MHAETRLPGLPAVAWWNAAAGASSLIGPDGCMDVISLHGRLVVVGADARARVHRGTAGTLTTGVRFDPGVLPQLLGVDADALADRQVPLAEVLGRRDVARLLDAAGRRGPGDPGPVAGAVRGDGTGASDLPSVAAIAAALCARTGRLDPRPLRVARALGFGLDVAQVAEEAGRSTRQLRRDAARWYGYGPKHLARVLRYRRAAVDLEAGASRADAAARAGYADASHLWRDERDLMTPS
ncbi:helix-turn-helix domain-containing protein [Brachybacterium phenoliresistens]|uniref:helix-turn-helix domain-containing protein n=1 Tax=Brachybacterium phenoliresistens TaxID=396014 RepID=UPI0031E107EA